MLFKYIENPDVEAPKEFVGLNLINAYKIKEASENLTTDIQDYDLALEEGLDVVLYKENCNKVPETGDYFFVNPQSHIYLYSAKEFEALYAVN